MLLEDNQGSSRLIIIETEEDVTELVIDWHLNVWFNWKKKTFAALFSKAIRQVAE